MDRILEQHKAKTSLKGIGDLVKESIDSGYLPKRPDLMLKLLEMTNNVNTFSEDVVNTLVQDEELSSKIVKHARIKLDSRAKEINTQQLQQSIQRLGFDFVQNTIEVDCSKRFLKCLKSADKAELISELRVALRTAFIAKNFARMINFKRQDYAFFTGLIHNMGKIIIGLKDQRLLSEIDEMVKRGMDEKSAELILLGYEHLEVSAKLSEAWELPKAIAEAIRYHEHPRLIKDEDTYMLASILRLSKYIAQALNNKERSPRQLTAKVNEYLRSLGHNYSEEMTLEKIKELYIQTVSVEDSIFASN